MLEVFSGVLNFLQAEIKGDIAPWLALSVTGAHLLIFVIEIIIALVKKPKKVYAYNACFSLIALVLEGYFAVCDLLSYRLVFISSQTVYIYLSISVILSALFYLVLYAVYNLKANKAPKKPLKMQEDVCESKPKICLSGAIEGLENTANGWLNVEYLKELISSLKAKNVKGEDLLELEDFEVYLLNFISREPNCYERKVLSSKINELIKKIAFYEAS